MAQKQENPAGCGVLGDGSGKFDSAEFTASAHNPQAAARAIAAGLICLPHPTDLAFILRRRLDLPERIWLAASALMALPPDTAEELAEATLHDLRAGPPIPPFLSIRDEAQSWATFASRVERCHYLAAAWGELSPDDRKSFLRRAL